jgi:hypothetical protein
MEDLIAAIRDSNEALEVEVFGNNAVINNINVLQHDIEHIVDNEITLMGSLNT